MYTWISSTVEKNTTFVFYALVHKHWSPVITVQDHEVTQVTRYGDVRWKCPVKIFDAAF